MKSIKYRLAYIFTSVILILLIGLGGILLAIVMQGIRKDTYQNLMNMAEQEAQYIQTLIEERLIYVNSLAESDILLDDTISFDEKVAYFEKAAKATGYQVFAYADSNGEATFFTKDHQKVDVSLRSYFQEALKGNANVSDLLISYSTGELSLYYAVPVYKEREIVGAFFGRRDGTVLGDIIKRVNYRQTGYAYIVNNEGVTVAHKDIGLVLSQDNDIENMKTDVSLIPLGNLTKEMIKRYIGSGSYTYYGVKKMVGYAPIEGTRWIMIYGIEESEALQRVYTIAKLLFVFIWISAAVGIIVTYLASAYISNPLIMLSKKMEDYGNDIPITIPEKYFQRKDEVGVLSKGIALMLEKISQHILELVDANEALLQAKEMIERERTLFQTTLHSLGDGVISTDKEGRVQIINEVAQSLTGWSREEAIGEPFEKVFYIINEISREKCSCSVKRTLSDNQIGSLEENTILIHKNGTEIPIEDSVAPILDAEGNSNGVVLVFRDCGDKKRAREEILYLSYHDQLTGLYNRRFFEEACHRLASSKYLPLSIAMFDVNGLKLTNDAFGHQVGDRLLKNVSNIIQTFCREEDIISRIGGDEFVLLLPRTTEEESEGIIHRIYKKFEQSKQEEVILSVSVGWATKTTKEQDILEVYARAEKMMYSRKLVESQNMRSKTIQLILKTLKEANPEEKIHSENVSKISREIGKAMGLDQDIIQELEMTGLMHDIGKIAIDNQVLNKPGELTAAEFEMVKKHSEIGYHILKSVHDYTMISEDVLAHHERIDGKGYPRGLKGDEIPLGAKIIAVAETYEAMTRERTYKQAVSQEEACEELKRCAGTQFDAQVVKIFCEEVVKD